MNYGEHETIVGDSQLSASERNRRLIPYMAFYLPPPEFPLNQQYLLQRVSKKLQQNMKYFTILYTIFILAEANATADIK